MMTGAQYRASLDDGRSIFFEGERVKSLPDHPILGPAVDTVAGCYDRFHSAARGAESPLMSVARSAADLKARLPLLHEADLVAHVTYQSIMTLTTAAARVGDGRYAERVARYVAGIRSQDLRVTECITDAKGDRSLPPGKQTDPDAYTRVVERRADGVVVRGAKLHISGACLGHELMVIPTKSMKPGEEPYAIACAVPVNAPGVKIVNTSYAPRHADTRDFPFSSRNSCPEGFVILDDVFVPSARVFLDGEAQHAGVFAHALGLWERLGSLSFLAEEEIGRAHV